MERTRVNDFAPARLDRRELLSVLLGASVATLASSGCSGNRLPPAGELLGPNFQLGHRLRDGVRPQVADDAWQSAKIVIVGGGVAGLSAAWQLARAGMKDFLLLELESQCGGTARGGQAGEFAFPWGAHYLPTPMKDNPKLIELLEEMQVVVARDENGEPVVAEQFLCRDPQERLFMDGQWIEGMYPALGASEDDEQQLAAFRQEIDSWINRRDESGRRMFAIPIAMASDVEEVRALDGLSMGEWLRQHGWTSERLRWTVDYACRDDYGLTVDQTSAWAGIFYFASRTANATESSQDVITWPAGNSRIVDHFVDQVHEFLRRGQAATEIRWNDAGELSVTAIDAATDAAIGYRAEHVILATPQFLAPYLIRDFEVRSGRSTRSFSYGSWVVANVHLSVRPAEAGFPMCWDNVIHGSHSLGYVTSTHQSGRDHGATVLTWYLPMTQTEGKISRQELLSLTWQDWAEVVITDLQLAHPDIAALITRLDVMRWGHAMVQPRVGAIWDPSRVEAQRSFENLHFANTDLSGVALFEEAFYHGVRAADEVLDELSTDAGVSSFNGEPQASTTQ